MRRAARCLGVCAGLLGVLACTAAPPPVSMLGEASPVMAPSTPATGGARAEVTIASEVREEYYATELRAAWVAFRDGDYERAMLGYERVVARADEPRIQIRALISLAMIRLLPSSKMHDEVAAQVVLEELDRRIESSGLRYEFFGELELLQLVARQDAALGAERTRNGRLRKELAARDALIRELRALSVEAQ